MANLSGGGDDGPPGGDDSDDDHDDDNDSGARCDGDGYQEAPPTTSIDTMKEKLALLRRHCWLNVLNYKYISVYCISDYTPVVSSNF